MTEKIVLRDDLADFIANELDINRFRDYCPNGLQVQGRERVGHIVTGVTASLAMLEAAREAGADAVIVHHGFFWRGEDARVIGPKHRRLKLLLANDINLFAYHLPLDAHSELGNNAQLGKRLGLIPESRFAEQELGWLGRADASVRTVGDLAAVVERALGRTPLLIGDREQPLGRVGWCTGAAQHTFGDAIVAGASVYLSGEISEQTVHLSHESGAAYLACGHHATERYGVQALGDYLAEKFGLSHQFIDIPNPV